MGFRPITWAFGRITIQSMDDLGRLQGRYPENFVLISQLEVCQEGGQEVGYIASKNPGVLCRLHEFFKNSQYIYV